jgi:cystathionine gamma-lyase
MELKPEKIKNQLDYDKKFENCGFSTKAIHVGNEPDGVYGGLSVPINLSTTYCQKTPSDPMGPFDYSRCGNPTRFSLERCLASIENGKYALAFASGMAATSACIHLLKTGDTCLSIDDVYGGTQRYFRKISAVQTGVEFDFIDFSDMELVKSMIKSTTKMVWLESPTNPTLKVTDIELVVKTVKSVNKDILIVVDNTFMSPYNMKPLDLGVDIVMESATKYLGGHSDVVMGVLACNSDELRERLYFISKSMGAVPSPFDCYLMLRGLKTLALRVERTNQNALKIAEYLEKNKKYVEGVLYAGLKSSPYHKIAKKQQKGFGGVISFYVKGGLEGAKTFLENVKIFTLAESLGAVESLAESPALMTHASVPSEKRKELGISDNLVRLSIGIEEVEDLIKDLDNAFSKIVLINNDTTSSNTNGSSSKQKKK